MPKGGDADVVFIDAAIKGPHGTCQSVSPRHNTSFGVKDSGEEQEQGTNASQAVPNKVVPAPFPIADWYLEPRDAGICRGFADQYKAANTTADDAGLFGTVHDSKGYGGELQLVEEYRTGSLLFSDLTNSAAWTCHDGRPQGDRMLSVPHPQLEFRHPHNKIHVHLEDKSDSSGGKVLWDAAFDMGGTEYLKDNAPALSGKHVGFEKICPPIIGPPHWYELVVTRQVPIGARPHLMEDFLGAQVFTAYRPEHDPELMAFRHNNWLTNLFFQ